jgi:hypothetical protein
MVPMAIRIKNEQTEEILIADKKTSLGLAAWRLDQGCGDTKWDNPSQIGTIK